MTPTGPVPVSPAAPSPRHDRRRPGTADGTERTSGLDQELPAGLLEGLQRLDEQDQARLDHARAWLAQPDHDEVPTCDELATCILAEARSGAER